MKRGILCGWRGGTKKQNMKFQQGNVRDKGFKLHLLLKPSHTKPAAHFWLKNIVLNTYQTISTYTALDGVKFPLSVLGANYHSTLWLSQSTREGEIVSPALFYQKRGALQRQPSQKCSGRRPTQNGSDDSSGGPAHSQHLK